MNRLSEEIHGSIEVQRISQDLNTSLEAGKGVGTEYIQRKVLSTVTDGKEKKWLEAAFAHLNRIDCRGQSKYAVKKQMRDHESGKYPKGIYSSSTYNTYAKHTLHFIQWALQVHPEIRKFNGAKSLVAEYLNRQIVAGLSVSTVHTRQFSLAAAFLCDSSDFGFVCPKRERKIITRSRSTAVEDTNHALSKEDAVLERFLVGTGCRRIEALRLRSSDLHRNLDGSYTVYLRGKGGKKRLAPVLPGYEQDVQAFFARPTVACPTKHGMEQRIFSKSELGHWDIHARRAQYASKLYQYYDAQIPLSPEERIYHCRKDMKGLSFRKSVLLRVSRALGHNRCDVVVSHYLYRLNTLK